LISEKKVLKIQVFEPVNATKEGQKGEPKFYGEVNIPAFILIPQPPGKYLIFPIKDKSKTNVGDLYLNVRFAKRNEEKIL